MSDTRLCTNNKKIFLEGMRDGIPIGLGYFAVSFSLGIAAKNAGLSVFQSFLASLLCNASAGEYAGFMSIAADSAYLEIAIVTFIANIRYLLMSCAYSQRIKPATSIIHRLLLGFYITDEFFGISISRKGYVIPQYTYGAVVVAAPCWAVGTALGTLAGMMLPLRIVSALSVALFGMFLAIIIPPSRKSKSLACVIVFSFISSFALSRIPIVSDLSDGTRTIILTIVISTLAAILFPKKSDEGEQNDA